MSDNSQKTPKALKQGAGSNFVIPFAIVLIGSIIVFGITKMLQNERSHRDLVRELHSKTFGNRWVAAYELSKVISSKSIPEEDIPWLVENLEDLYDKAVDVRTKNFIIVAAGSLRSELCLGLLKRGLGEDDSGTVFHAIVALSNFPKGIEFDWGQIISFLESDDEGLVLSSMLTLATHQVKEAENLLIQKLTNSSKSVRYAAATGLIYYKNTKNQQVIREILNIGDKQDGTNPFGPDKIYGLKINVLNALKVTGWNYFNEDLRQSLERERDLKIVSKTREVLESLED